MMLSTAQHQRLQAYFDWIQASPSVSRRLFGSSLNWMIIFPPPLNSASSTQRRTFLESASAMNCCKQPSPRSTLNNHHGHDYLQSIETFFFINQLQKIITSSMSFSKDYK
jgi:hypothetical protein